MRLLKEKVAQSSKQIEEQVEVIESKNIAIENLLFKMEKLTDSLTQKTNQVTELQEEIEKLKAVSLAFSHNFSLSFIKNAKESSIDYKAQQQQTKNVGSLYAKIRDKGCNIQFPCVFILFREILVQSREEARDIRRTLQKKL